MNRSDNRALIRQTSLFADLDDDEIERLLDHMDEVEYPDGSILFEPGDPRDYMRIILSGRIDLESVDGVGRPLQLVSYGRGYMIGEGVLLEGTVHTTRARAFGKVRALEITRTGFARLFSGDSELKARVLTGFVRDVVGRVDQMRHRAGPEALAFASGRTRREHDLLGELEVPAEAYYGVQTARALENFHITGVHLQRYPALVRALARVKLATARANRACGALGAERARAIEDACKEIVLGRWHDHFVVDVVQGGAGTSTNMNAHEVIANRALELLGREKGDYAHLHPNNDVNRSQSTNDAYPTALKLAMAEGVGELVAVVRDLVEAFRVKGREFAEVIKMGRTQLQDAVPMTLGQAFCAYASSIAQEIQGLELASTMLLEVNMGGTAIGTGLNAPEGYADKVVAELRELSGLDIRLAEDLIEATQDTQAFVMVSSALKSLAIKLSKIASDLRLLSSGPRAGINEIRLPPRQPGSSIMPGKVNPVIPEVVNQVAFRVLGNDLTVSLAAEAGQLELNVMEPVIAAAILDSIEVLSNASATFRVHCVEGVTANEDVCRAYVENSIGTVTALVPVLGYEVSTELAAEALRTGRGIVEIVRERKLLSEDEIAQLLAPENMTNARPRA